MFDDDEDISKVSAQPHSSSAAPSNMSDPFRDVRDPPRGAPTHRLQGQTSRASAYRSTDEGPVGTHTSNLVRRGSSNRDGDGVSEGQNGAGSPEHAGADAARYPSDSDDDERDAEEKRVPTETVCTIVLKELDPRSIVGWGRLFVTSSVRAGRVLGTMRNIKAAEVISAFVNTALLFTFSCVFSTTIFSEVGLADYVPMGVSMHLLSVLISQISMSLFSDCALAVCGPDVNPTIFLATMVIAVREAMVQHAKLREPTATYSPTTAPSAYDPSVTDAPSVADPSGVRRRLAEHAPVPDLSGVKLDERALLATVLATIMIATASLGVFLYLVGRLRLARVVQLVPGNVLAGFMASLGYLVLLKALHTAMAHEIYDKGPGTAEFWILALPGLPIGIAMYLQKRWHVGSPVIALPLILGIPLILFFTIVYGSGSDIEKARHEGWLYPAFESSKFYSTFNASYASTKYVDWEAIQSGVPTLLVMCFIVTIDALLKQAGSRNLLQLHDLRFDHEVMLAGKMNIVHGILVGVPSYMHLKLVAINFGVVRNKETRVPGLIISALIGALFFAGFPLVNYLPRFWLSGVLYFASMGFLVENLWDARLRFSRKDYLSIWAIVVTNALFGLAWSVLVGVVLSMFIFAMAYGKGGAVKRFGPGEDFPSRVLRDDDSTRKLNRLGRKVAVLQLHRYIFFGSASFVNDVVQGLLKDQASIPEEARVSFFVFDWTEVEDVDMTALGVVKEMLTRILGVPGDAHATSHATTPEDHAESDETPAKPIVVFTGLSQRLRKSFVQEKILQQIHEPEFAGAAAASSGTEEDELAGIVGPHRRCFETLDRGMEWVEEALLEEAAKARAKFLTLPSFDALHRRRAALTQDFDFEYLMGSKLGAREFWGKAQLIQVPKGWVLSERGRADNRLYALRSGALTVVSHRGERVRTLLPGAFVNQSAPYLEDKLHLYGSESGVVVVNTVKAEEDSVVLVLDKAAVDWLDQMHPRVAVELHRAILRTTAKIEEQMMRQAQAEDATGPSAQARRDKKRRARSLRRIAPETSMTTNNSVAVDFAADPENPTSPARGDETPGSPQRQLPVELDGTADASATTDAPSSGGGLNVVTSAARRTVEGVTNTTRLAVQGVSATTQGLAKTSVAMVQGGLILSGLKKGDGADDGLLDAGDLVEGSGTRMARRFKAFSSQPGRGGRKQASTSGVEEDASPADFGSLRGFRSRRAPTDASDGETPRSLFSAADAMYARANRPAVSPNLVPKPSLCAGARARATGVFLRCLGSEIPRAPVQTGPLTWSRGMVANRASVAKALEELGLPTDVMGAETEFYNLEAFLALATRAIMGDDAKFAQTTRAAVYAFERGRFERPEGSLLTIGDLERMIGASSGGSSASRSMSSRLRRKNVDVLRFVQKWSEQVEDTQGLTLSAWCSAAAEFAWATSFDAALRSDWSRLLGASEGGGDGLLRAKDYARAFDVSPAAARRSLWYLLSDTDDTTGVISFDDLMGELLAP